MSTPGRRLSPAVYRRRRVVAISLLLAVAAVVVLLILQPWRGAAETVAAPTATPTRSASQTTPPAAPSTSPPATETAPATSEAPVAAAPCTAADLLVEGLIDATEYGGGQNPQLSIRLTNRSGGDCTMNVGTTGQTFTVLSGDDVWWRSTDCQTESADQIVTLAAGASVTSVAPVAWDRTRSSVDTCGSDRPVAPGGGATYRLSVSIGGVVSSNDTNFLLY